MFIIKQMMILYLCFEIMMVFMGVVFVTVLERKILGLIQIRLGPNKIIFKGMFQSMSDALKLMFKSNIMLFFMLMIEYNFLPIGMMMVMMTLWMFMPGEVYEYSNNLLLMMCVFSVGVYPIMYGSWFSSSFYSMLGSIRSIAQMVSYEVSMIMIILGFVIFTGDFNLNSFWWSGFKFMFMLMFMLMLILFTSILVELGRTPVDLLEGESELVSGFNTEYFGMKFALIFLSEYGMIMFMGGLISCLCFGFKVFSLWWGLGVMILIIMVYWIRSIMPRIRYDKLMIMCWISMMSLSLGMLTINVGYLVNW